MRRSGSEQFHKFKGERLPEKANNLYRLLKKKRIRREKERREETEKEERRGEKILRGDKG